MAVTKAIIRLLLLPLAQLILLFVLIPLALISRLHARKIDVGLGPESIINNPYYKQCLLLYGYIAETYVAQDSFITNEFDIIPDHFGYRRYLPRAISDTLFRLHLFGMVLWRYRCLFIYFTGGILGTASRHTIILHRAEPYLYKLAGIKVIVQPFGSDVHVLSRTPNLWFRNGMIMQHPGFKNSRWRIMAQIDRWTRHADHIIGHTDEIEHLYHWDTLSVSNLCINIDEWPFTPPDVSNTKRPLRILHAPNHRHIKGSQWFIDTIDELRAEGIALEFVILEGVPNNQIKEVMKSVDVIADQLILGWHGMFALEAMAMGKPVLCYLREDLLEFFMVAGLLQPGELPIINCNPLTVKEIIRDLALNREQLIGIGNRSRKYVVEHHSLEAIGAVFDQIMRSLEITPGDAPQ